MDAIWCNVGPETMGIIINTYLCPMYRFRSMHSAGLRYRATGDPLRVPGDFVATRLQNPAGLTEPNPFGSGGDA